ncbi:XRE family transcriptional regulator [Sandarakinorhabdus oryzae]|uniref:XRE family transcriptional regulator n=1 Tax=Sandarakinorhabdus oryzae TaxID=2675220 RepID=UPI0012E23868|nr:XRE family transcriptional regulator [Sandarakinorhabdus oryzae]
MTSPPTPRDPSGFTSLDDWLDGEGFRDEVTLAATKRVVALHLEDAIAAAGITKSALAAAMGTSRKQLDRLLDPNEHNVTLLSLAKAAQQVGKRLKVELVD